MREIRSPGSVRGVPGDGDSYREPNHLLRSRISLHLKPFPCPATSEGLNTLFPPCCGKALICSPGTPGSRYEVCEMSGLGLPFTRKLRTRYHAGWRAGGNRRYNSRLLRAKENGRLHLRTIKFEEKWRNLPSKKRPSYNASLEWTSVIPRSRSIGQGKRILRRN